MSLDVIEHAPPNSDGLLADVWAGIASFRQMQGHPEAHASCEKAIELAEKSGNGPAIHIALFQKACLLWRSGNGEEAQTIALQCLELASEAGDRPILLTMLLNLGIRAIDNEQLGEAKEYFEQSLEICESMGHLRGIAITQANLGHLREKLGDYKTAYRYFAGTLPIFLALGDDRSLAEVLSKIGCGFWIARDFESAARTVGCEQRLKEGMELYPKGVDENKANPWCNRLIEEMGEDAFAAAFEIGKQTPTKEIVAMILANPEPWENG
jgi:tetratricopeptide (TPR) repeat protein